MSVTTTTLFYLTSFGAMVLVLLDADNPLYKEEQLMKASSAVFIAWLLDTIFNDLCILFVGFGPTTDALTAVANVASVDIIGVPYSSGAEEQIELEVAGVVVASPFTPDPSPK